MSKYTICYQNENGEMVERDMTDAEVAEHDEFLAGLNPVPTVNTPESNLLNSTAEPASEDTEDEPSNP